MVGSNLAWDDTTGYYSGVSLVKNFDVSVDALIVDMMGSSMLDQAISTAGGTVPKDIIHTGNIEWKDLSTETDLDTLVGDEQISILTITDSESYAAYYGALTTCSCS